MQACLLADKLQALKEEEERLADFAGQYEELLNELSEEDRERPFVNEDAFVPAEVKKSLKAGELDEATLAVLKKVDALISREKSLKRKSRKTPSHCTCKQSMSWRISVTSRYLTCCGASG